METPALRTGIALLIFAILLAFSGFGASAHGQLTLEQVQSALPELDRFAREALHETGVPGTAIAVVFRDEVVYLQGFGVRKAGSSEPITADTAFQLASMSKPIASSVISALVSDGIVTWDDRITALDPEFRLSDPWMTNEVTLRDLFAHRSGLPGGAGNDLEELGFTRSEILKRLRHLEPAGPFRASYAYSNFGMTAGGAAAARAAGMSWEEAAAERLYRPLGMSSTSSRYEDFLAEGNRAHLHTLVNGQWTPEFTRNADAQSPAGGVSSSVRDLTQWMRLQLADGNFAGEQLIDETALAQTHQPHIVSGAGLVAGTPSFYGLGWVVNHDAAGRLHLTHSGAFSAGARTAVSLLPSEGIGIVVLTNAFPTGIPEALNAMFLDQLFEGEVTRDWLGLWNGRYDSLADSFTVAASQYASPPAEPSPALPASAYTGHYANPYFGPLNIAGQRGELSLILGPEAKTFPLKHWDRDTFLYYASPETPDVPSSVTFTIGSAGRATGLLLNDLNDSGQGTFTRTTGELLEGFEAVFRREMKRFNVPGAAVAVVQGNEIIYAEGFGLRSVKSREPVTTETAFRVGSTTKSMTSLLVAMQVEEGLFDWETPVVNLIPGFSLPSEELTQAIQVQDLMGMGTGLAEGLSFLYWQDPSVRVLMDKLVDSPVMAEPGEMFLYNNHLYSAAGFLAPLAAGVPYDELPAAYAELMQEHVFGPIGMNAMIADAANLLSSNYAVGHENTVLGGMTPETMPDQPLAAVAPAGATVTDVLGMARYLITQLNGGVTPDGSRLVSPEQLKRTWVPVTPFPPAENAPVQFEGYAMGWLPLNYNGISMLNHSGGAGGFRTEMLLLPDSGFGIVVLTNSFSGQWFSNAMLFEFVDAMFGFENSLTEWRLGHYETHVAELAELAETVTVPTVDAASVADLLGEYERGWQLELHDGTLRLNGNGYDFRLLPVADGYIADNGGDEIGTGFRFSRRADGAVTLSISDAEDTVMKLPAPGQR